MINWDSFRKPWESRASKVLYFPLTIQQVTVEAAYPIFFTSRGRKKWEQNRKNNLKCLLMSYHYTWTLSLMENKNTLLLSNLRKNKKKKKKKEKPHFRIYTTQYCFCIRCISKFYCKTGSVMSANHEKREGTLVDSLLFLLFTSWVLASFSLNKYPSSPDLSHVHTTQVSTWQMSRCCQWLGAIALFSYCWDVLTLLLAYSFVSYLA